MARRFRFRFEEPTLTAAAVDAVRRIARPLDTQKDLDPLMERIGDARIVLLGEGSHGTAEYYEVREMITQRLITEKGFSFVAVEGDWPDAYRLNRYVKRAPNSGANARDVLQSIERWPAWMWANEEIVSLAEWLRSHNGRLHGRKEKVGFYGLDVYSLHDSMKTVVAYMERLGGYAAETAREAFECFEPYGDNLQEYARTTAWTDESCENEVIRMLASLRIHANRIDKESSGANFNAEQNALVIKNAEHYYRTMVRGDAASWNIRDRHMGETLDRLLIHYGPESKAIVWAHNTHVGDARHTDMVDDGMINVGQLAREKYGEKDVVIVGFSSNSGSVIAASAWEDPMQAMRVPEARAGSWEQLLHKATDGDNALVIFDRNSDPALLEARGHRAIGVVYHPEYEDRGNYVPTVLPKRYDAIVYLDQTSALHPLHNLVEVETEVPETYPSGF